MYETSARFFFFFPNEMFLSSDEPTGLSEFLSAPAHMIALDLSWIRSCHEAMASTHFKTSSHLK